MTGTGSFGLMAGVMSGAGKLPDRAKLSFCFKLIFFAVNKIHPFPDRIDHVPR